MARRSRSLLAPSGPILRPPMIRSPSVGVSIMVTTRASVDLPDPDSPTTASVLPGVSVKLAPSSARTVALGFMKPPFTS